MEQSWTQVDDISYYSEVASAERWYEEHTEDDWDEDSEEEWT